MLNIWDFFSEKYSLLEYAENEKIMKLYQS